MCRNTPSVPRHVHKHSFLLLFATGDMYITGTHCHQYTITCAHHIYQHSFFLLYYHRCNQSHLLLVHIDHRRRLRQGQSYKMGSRQLVQLFSQLKTFHCWQSHDIHTIYIYIYIRVWHSWKFWYEWMSEYICINKITRMNILIYSY